MDNLDMQDRGQQDLNSLPFYTIKTLQMKDLR